MTLTHPDIEDVAASEHLETSADTKVATLFTDAEDLLYDTIDGAGFAGYRKTFGVTGDDRDPAYWSAVRTVIDRSVELNKDGTDSELALALRILGTAPDAMNAQLEMKQRQEAGTLTREIRSRLVDRLGPFNDLLRDFAGSHLDMSVDGFTLRLIEAANAGIRPELRGMVPSLMGDVVAGIRTEVGFEQKLDAAGMAWRRGEAAEDKVGIDYEVGGVKIDIKSSLFKLQEEGLPQDHPRAWFMKHGKVILFPYEYDQDYQNGTFRLSDEAKSDRALQLASDLSTIRQVLRLS